jgi:glyoxylase-like metal-dependent hydrolase (beta-lactamase superfamily II)
MSKLQIETLSLGELDTNCYIAWCDDTKEAVIIDPADAGESIAEQVLALQLHPTAILLTHAHFDHVLGALAVQLSFDIRLYLHPADNTLLSNAQKSAEYWLKHAVDPVPPATHQLNEGDIITVGECELLVIHTPGHTPGSCSFYYKNTSLSNRDDFTFSEPSAVFVGDVIFKDGIGRTDHSYSKKKDLYTSIQKIKDLGSVRVYSGHGESFMSEDNSLLTGS